MIARFPGSLPVGLRREIQERLNGPWEWVSVNAECCGPDPLEFVRQQICPDVSAGRVGTIPALVATPAFQRKLIWIEGVDLSAWQMWSVFLKAYAHVCRNVQLPDRTTFVIALCGDAASVSVPDELGLNRCDFRNVFDQLDMLAFAASNAPSRIRPREHRTLFAHVVAQISQWDIVLAEQLLRVPLRTILEPTNILRKYGHDRGWTPMTPPLWEHGTTDGPDNAPVVHTAFLEICGDKRAVRQRMWAAQAAALFPVVEERRIELVTRYRGSLKLPVVTEDGSSINNPFDLDIGQLARQLDRAGRPPTLRRQTRTLRQIRNRLAHMQSLDPEYALHRALFTRC